MKKLLTWVKEMLTDERGDVSSKRFVGVIGALCLFIALFVAKSDVSDTLVQTVGLLSASALGLTSIDKWAYNKKITK